MRIASLLLLASCASDTERSPLADQVNEASGYQVLVCLPLNYAAPDLTFGANVESSGDIDRHIEFQLLGYEGFPLHCALLPSMPPRMNYDRVTHYTVTLDEPLKEDKRGELTLIYFPSTIDVGQDGTQKVMADYRTGITPVKTRVESGDRQTFSFNVAPAAVSDDVTIAMLPIPEGGLFNPIR